jgi:hypothetical protein
MSSRYSAIANLLWIADLGFAGLLASRKAQRRRWLAFVSLVVVCAALSSLYGAVGFAYRGRELAALRAELLRDQPFHVTSLREPSPRYLESLLPALREQKLSLFRDGAPAAPSDILVPPLEEGAVKGEVARRELGGGNIELYGWAQDGAREVEALLVVRGQEPLYEGPTFFPRPGAAVDAGSLAPLLSGFSLVVPAEAGGGPLRVLALSRNGTASELALTKSP